MRRSSRLRMGRAPRCCCCRRRLLLLLPLQWRHERRRCRAWRARSAAGRPPSPSTPSAAPLRLRAWTGPSASRFQRAGAELHPGPGMCSQRQRPVPPPPPTRKPPSGPPSATGDAGRAPADASECCGAHLCGREVRQLSPCGFAVQLPGQRHDLQIAVAEAAQVAALPRLRVHCATACRSAGPPPQLWRRAQLRIKGEWVLCCAHHASAPRWMAPSLPSPSASCARPASW
jgi:hypothetical protein